MSYLMYLAGFSPSLARQYFNFALQACRVAGAAPNFLLHPPDFMDLSQTPDMAFFPGMKLSKEKKRELFMGIIGRLAQYYDIVNLSTRAHSELGKKLPLKKPS